MVSADNFYGHAKLIKKPSATISAQHLNILLLSFLTSILTMVALLVHTSRLIHTLLMTQVVQVSLHLRNSCLSFTETWFIRLERLYRLSVHMSTTLLQVRRLCRGHDENPLETFQFKSIAGGYEMPIPTESYHN